MAFAPHRAGRAMADDGGALVDAAQQHATDEGGRRQRGQQQHEPPSLVGRLVEPVESHEWNISGPAPHRDATELAEAWMDAHVLSFRKLSQRVRRLVATNESRARFLSRAPAVVGLSTCGRLVAPFGGAMLAGFEAHLRAFVINASSAQAVGGGQANSGLTQGYMNKVVDFIPSDPTRLGAVGPIVLRTGRWTSRGKRDAAHRCRLYRGAVWNGYVQWILGELDIFPRMALAWLTWTNRLRSIDVETLVERWTTLSDVLQQPPVGVEAVADRLFDCFEALSRGSGLIGLDIKPKDMLIRFENGRWEARLSDIDITAVANYKSLYAGVPVPYLHPDCALLMFLQLSTTLLACGPARDTEMARRFVARAFAAHEERSTWSSLLLDASLANNAKQTAARLKCQETNHPLRLPMNKSLFYEQDAIAKEEKRLRAKELDGWIDSKWLYQVYTGKTVADNSRKEAIHALHTMVYRAWQRDRIVACPANQTWDDRL